MALRMKRSVFWDNVLVILVLAIIISLCFKEVVYAMEGGKLTDIFSNADSAFKGSWAMLRHLNIVGFVMQGIISVFSLVGLCARCVTVLITMLYLSMKPTFDLIHDIKSTGSGILGIPGMYKEIFQGKRGKGLDAIIYLVLALLPDMKDLSEYNDQYRVARLEDTDTVGIYLAKSSIPTVLQIFFFSVGFNGQLWLAYGKVVDAMSVAASYALEVDLDNYVERLLLSGGNYSFDYADSDEPIGELQQSIAKDVYVGILSELDNESLTPELKQSLGIKVKEFMDDRFGVITLADDGTYEGFDDELEDYLTGIKYQFTKSDTKNLKCQVTVNTTSKYGTEAICVSATGGGNDSFEFGLSSADAETKTEYDLYVHIWIRRESKASKPQYFNYTGDK